MFRQLLLPASAMVALSSSSAAPYPRAAQDGHTAIPLLWKYGFMPAVTTDIVWGTPGQRQPVETVFDTGSNNFWVAGPDNLAFYGSRYHFERGPCNVTLTPYYDWTISTTHTPPVEEHNSYSYGGNAHWVHSYYNMNDTLGFAQGNYPKLLNRKVAVSNETIYSVPTDPSCPKLDMDHSILGMGPTSTFRRDLVNDGLASSNILSIWFDRAPADPRGTYNGTALIGALPPSSKYRGDLVPIGLEDLPSNTTRTLFYQVATPQFMTAPLHKTGGPAVIPLAKTPATCLLDTGVSNLELPISAAIADMAGLALTGAGSVLAYNGSCDSIPAEATLDIVFRNVTISVPYRNLIRGYFEGVQPVNSACVLSVTLEETSCILGAPFFSAAAVVFDDAAKTVSLAQGGIWAESMVSGDGSKVPV